MEYSSDGEFNRDNSIYIYPFVLRADWRYVGAFGISMVQRCSNKL